MFESDTERYDHSLKTLNEFYEFDDFMDSIDTILDVGCGAGYDTNWWATAETRDTPPKPHNYHCFAIDSTKTFKEKFNHKNVTFTEASINKRLPFKNDSFDLIWCHDAFSYSTNPLFTLSEFNRVLSQDGMLYLCLPQTSFVQHNKFKNLAMSYQPFSHHITSLIYILALNGFDCDTFFRTDGLFIHSATYKVKKPFDYEKTSWYDLIEAEMLSANMNDLINHRGFLCDQGLLIKWLDGSFIDFR